jgi:hypothetical protein
MDGLSVDGVVGCEVVDDGSECARRPIVTTSTNPKTTALATIQAVLLG